MPARAVHAAQWLMVCVFLLAAATQPGRAQDGAPGDEQNFDLPARPLGDALTQFASMTHLNIAFASSSVRGLRSAPVSGRYTAAAALKRLLLGTGQVAAFTGPRSAVVYRAGSAPPDAMVANSSGATLELDMAEVRAAAPLRIGRRDPQIGIDYARRAQGEIQDILGDEPEYRGRPMTLRVGVSTDGVGRITEVRVGRGRDEFDRDRSLPALLIGHRLAEAPPPGLIQPIWFDVIIDPLRTGKRRARAQ